MVIGVVFGAILWILLELNKGLKKDDFSYEKFMKLNLIPVITNIACGLVVLWMRDDIEQYFVVTKFSSVILGMAGQGIFKKLYGIVSKDIETHIGINNTSK